MRKRIVIVLVSLLGYTTVSGAGREWRIPAEQPLFTSAEQQDCAQAVVDCTIHINFTTDDGTKISGDLTFVGIPWWECVAIKIGNFLSKLF